MSTPSTVTMQIIAPYVTCFYVCTKSHVVSDSHGSTVCCRFSKVRHMGLQEDNEEIRDHCTLSKKILWKESVIKGLVKCWWYNSCMRMWEIKLYCIWVEFTQNPLYSIHANNSINRWFPILITCKMSGDLVSHWRFIAFLIFFLHCETADNYKIWISVNCWYCWKKGQLALKMVYVVLRVS